MMYTPEGDVAQAHPATGRTFAACQTHWSRVAGGQIVEHRTDRDDLGRALQLGWFSAPPSAG